MPRHVYLDKKARRIVLDQMRNSGEMSGEQIMDLIHPRFLWDAQIAREQAIRRQANSLVRSLRDENGVRSCFKLERADMYVNIDISSDLFKVTSIARQLEGKIQGLASSLGKAKTRCKELEGQMSMFSAADI